MEISNQINNSPKLEWDLSTGHLKGCNFLERYHKFKNENKDQCQHGIDTSVPCNGLIALQCCNISNMPEIKQYCYKHILEIIKIKPTWNRHFSYCFNFKLDELGYSQEKRLEINQYNITNKTGTPNKKYFHHISTKHLALSTAKRKEHFQKSPT